MPMDVDDPAALQRERDASHTMEPTHNTPSEGIFIDLTGHSEPSFASQTVVPDNSGPVDRNTGPTGTTMDPIVFYPQGDTLLKIEIEKDNKSKTFQASQACLRLMNAPWFYLGDNQHNLFARTYWKVENDDQVKVIELALQAAHLQHDKMPQVLSWKMIVNVAKVGKQHKILAPLRPYLDTWVLPYVDKALKPGYEMWLLVAYVFGYEDVFQHVLEHTAIIMQAISSHNADTGERKVQYAMPSGTIISEETFGKDVLDALIHLRNIFVTPIIDSAHRCVDRLFNPPNPSTLCSQECHAMVLGSLIQGLKPLNIWPQKPSVPEITLSALDLFTSLQKIKVHSMKKHSWIECSLDEVRSMKLSVPPWPGLAPEEEPLSTAAFAVRKNGHVEPEPDAEDGVPNDPVSFDIIPAFIPLTLLWKSSAVYKWGFRASDFFRKEDAGESGDRVVDEDKESDADESESGDEDSVGDEAYDTEDEIEDMMEEEPPEEYCEDEDEYESDSEGYDDDGDEEMDDVLGHEHGNEEVGGMDVEGMEEQEK
ncbi:hypothetical protein P154DRAFT_577063 [Amniculicola lignicola CBS 123094]|uniref:Uncharacterized protein n=1 Tax=Amniculicola lignicola CBS 123094 TaxID=1392246 RepID=A0A6A5WCE4_9PLEO|nr:hypothetical protein P154DRAFT_577063 [Amniculicola lignicola CBS 123094]